MKHRITVQVLSLIDGSVREVTANVTADTEQDAVALHTRKQLIEQIAAIRAEMPETEPVSPAHTEIFDVAADGKVTNKPDDAQPVTFGVWREP